MCLTCALDVDRYARSSNSDNGLITQSITVIACRVRACRQSPGLESFVIGNVDSQKMTPWLTPLENGTSNCGKACMFAVVLAVICIFLWMVITDKGDYLYQALLSPCSDVWSITHAKMIMSLLYYLVHNWWMYTDELTVKNRDICYCNVFYFHPVLVL